jgi:hypothetical protein
MNADGAKPRRLSHNPVYDEGPAWRPDGNIDYGFRRNRRLQIGILRLSRADAGRMTEGGALTGVRGGLAWSRGYRRPSRAISSADGNREGD